MARAAAAARVAVPARHHPAAPVRRAPARPAPRRRGGPAPRPAATGRALLRSGAVATLDRLLRGPALIALVFLLLVGVVFANVALLQKNRQIARDAEAVSALKSDTAKLRGKVAELGSSERIQAEAAALGLVSPAPADVSYLHSNPAVDARNAAQRLDASASGTATSVP
jgi:cell division protein FtsL